MDRPLKVAVNGFGRIGRVLMRVAKERSDGAYEIILINDPGIPLENAAYLLKYDTTYGRYDGDVSYDPTKEKIGEFESEGKLIVDDREIQYFSLSEGRERPAKLPYKALGVDVVVESSGLFRNPEQANVHLESGAKYAVVTAPFKGKVDPSKAFTVIMKINEGELNLEKHRIISPGSCTTNALVPMVYILDKEFGIVNGFMTTVHAYTRDQQLVDGPHKDMSRGRAAAQNMVITKTGAADLIGKIFSHLEGKLDGYAVRVPTVTGSLVDLTVELKESDLKPKDLEEVFTKYSEGELDGILAVTEDPIVSSDVIGDEHSCIIPSKYIKTEPVAKVFGFYDNEWGYVCRLNDLLKKLAEEL
jgi:glyceraldehyde 3-phosphate dehydrogenase